MPDYVLDFHLPTGNRREKREALICLFLNEHPGSGVGIYASRYRYNVEKYGGYGIYLKRPTQLNKGFDFTVNIQGIYFKKDRRYSNPSHQDIFNVLAFCKKEYPREYALINNAILGFYHCRDTDYEDLACINAPFTDYLGEMHPIQVILLAIKWLFIEQDCAYWNYSGRAMLFDELAKRALATPIS